MRRQGLLIAFNRKLGYDSRVAGIWPRILTKSGRIWLKAKSVTAVLQTPGSWQP